MFLSFESTLVSTFSWGLCAEFCALLIALSPAVLLQVSEVYLEPSQTSTMELFCENSWRLLAVNYFQKKAPSQMFDWV